MSAKAVSPKTLYNRSTDGWAVQKDGATIEGRAAILAIAAGSVVTLKRGTETETLTVAGEGDALPGELAIILDGLSNLRTEDRKVLEAYVRGNAQLNAGYQALADMSLKVASNTAALNGGLSLSLAQAYGENMRLKALYPHAGESQESWLDRVLLNLPQLVSAGRLLMSPLPEAPPTQPAAPPPETKTE